jgi:GT2 family glycosyltransferase
MISVIYSTRVDNQKHIDHIKKTSGLSKTIEVIQYINNGEFSLTEIYNKGLIESKNDIVVFCHDDVIFNRDGWGKKLIYHFENTDYGILGIAGTTDLPDTGKWWEDRSKMIGIVKHSNNGKTWESRYSSNFEGDVLESVSVDGLFFVAHKKRIKSNFDESIKGFHFYDIDFTFNNHILGTKVGVIFDVKITHMSIGETNSEWEKNRIQFVEKFKNNLPHKIKPEIKVNHKEIFLKEKPKLGIIIPTKGNVDLLKQCINSIFDNDGYTMFKIYIADTGSSFEELSEIKNFINKIGDSIVLIEYDYYNFASINNDVVMNHIDDDTELLLFCNNDIKLINNAITRMVDVYNKNKKIVGTIGARLHYEDNSIQHSGITMFVSQNGRMVNIHLTHYGLKSYYNYHKEIKKDIFGNTAAFIMISKNLFLEIGGFDTSYLECFEDVKLNIECLNKNKINIFVGESVCYHFESQTRNKVEDKLKKEAEDYTNRIIPFIIDNKKTYNYFTNIKAKDLEILINNGRTNN